MSCNCLTTLPLRRLLCRAPYKQPWLLWCPVPGIMLRMCRHLTARLGRRCQHHPHGTDKAPTPSPSGASSSHSGETEGTCPHAELSGCSWLTGPAPPLPRPSTAPPRGSAHSSSPGAATLPLAASLPRAEAAETQRETHLHSIPGTIQRTFQNVSALGDSHSELPFQESHFLFLLKCVNTTGSSYLWARKTQILGSQIDPTWRIQSQLRLPLCWEQPPGGAPLPESAPDFRVHPETVTNGNRVGPEPWTSSMATGRKPGFGDKGHLGTWC